MNTNILQGLEPQSVFSYFEQLTRIPRGSGNEKAVSDYIIAYAEEHGYRWERDKNNNVKLLQAHLDMVCAKDPDVVFNFETQPIDIYVEEGFVKARGTTLGADDGAGVAMILALLDDRTLPHPPVQAIFTTGVRGCGGDGRPLAGWGLLHRAGLLQQQEDTGLRRGCQRTAVYAAAGADTGGGGSDGV